MLYPKVDGARSRDALTLEGKNTQSEHGAGAATTNDLLCPAMRLRLDRSGTGTGLLPFPATEHLLVQAFCRLTSNSSDQNHTHGIPLIPEKRLLLSD